MNKIKKTMDLEDEKVSTKVKISALWIAILFIFAYVDIFSFYKPEIIPGIQAGKMFIFQITQTFVFLTTLYIVIPSLMVFLSLVLPPKVNRLTNIIVAIFYLVTILGSCIGETWVFYLFGSLVESILLGVIIWYAVKWPKQNEGR
jgi:hypothetical protein